MAPTYRIFIIEDHPLVLEAVRSIVQAETDLEVVGSARNGTQGERHCIRLQPDLMLLDLHIPGKAPLEIVQSLHQRSPRTKILINSAFCDPTYIQSLIRVGIDGYILKEESPDLLLMAISSVLHDATWFSQEVLQAMRPSPPPTLRSKLTVWRTLSTLEQTILLAIGQGLSNHEIAHKLHFAPQTARNYCSQLYQKLGLETRYQLITWLRTYYPEAFTLSQGDFPSAP